MTKQSRAPLGVESLEVRDLLAIDVLAFDPLVNTFLDINVTAVANLTISYDSVSDQYTLSDPTQTVTLPPAPPPTLTGSGTNTLTIGGGLFSGAFNSIRINLGNFANTVSVNSSVASGGRAVSLVGGAGADRLQGSSGNDTFSITGAGSGTVLGVTFSSINTVDGQGGNDEFFFNGGSLSGSVIGGSGTDTIFGTTGADAFVITGANAGTFSLIGSGWSEVEGLEGRDDNDTFTFSAPASRLSGEIVGGLGFDTITARPTSDDFFTVSINGALLETGSIGSSYLPTETSNVLNGFQGIESISGGGQASLTGDQIRIDPANNDTMGLAPGAGGNGQAVNVVTESFLSYTGIETDNRNAVLVGTPGADTFIITGDGAVTFGADSFTGVRVIGGLAGGDTFTFQNGGRIAGTIYGGSGNDTINGGAQDEVFDLQQIVTTGSAPLQGGQGQIRLAGLPVTPANTVANEFRGIENLNGGAGTGDVLEADAATLAVAPATTTTGTVFRVDGSTPSVTYSGIDSLADFTLAGTSGNDVFDIIGDGVVTLNGTTYSGVVNLLGLGGTDRFEFFENGTLVGFIDGGTGANSAIFGVDTAATAALAADVFVITGDNSGTYLSNNRLGQGFRNISSLFGQGGDDRVTFDSGTLSGDISGGGGTNTLEGVDTVPSGTGNNDFFVVNQPSQGTYNRLTSGASITWSGFSIINGRGGDDQFTINDSGSFSGTLSGGTGSDTLFGRQTAASLYSVTAVGADGASGSMGTDTANASNLVGSFTGINQITGRVDGVSGFDSLTADAATLGITPNSFGGTIRTLSGPLFTANFAGTVSPIAPRNFTLCGTDLADTFNVEGAGVVRLNGGLLPFSTVINICGLGGDDVVSFDSGGSISGFVDGGDDNDTLFGIDSSVGLDDTFVITGSNSGTYSPAGGGWRSVESLNGRGGNDLFQFVSGGSLSGSITGGADSDRIEGVDTVPSGTANNDLFVVTGNNSGTYSLVTGGWSTVESLDGRGGDDTFRFEENGQLAGSVLGGSGTDTVEGVDTGAGTSSNDLFVITGTNSGTYSRVTSGWSAVENLNGRGGNDTFRFEENGQLSGSVLGGSGSDTIEGVDTGAGTSSNDLFVITGSNSGTYSRVASGWSTVENLNGRGGNDTFRFEENGQLAGSVLGGSGTDTIEGVDTGAGTSSNDLFVITGSNSGTYSRVTGGWSTVENLNGRGGDDTFRFEENGQLSGSVLGGSGSDTIEGVDTGAGTSSNDLFVVTGSNSGSYSRVTGGWSTVENLNGRGGDDTFRFEENGQLSGSVLGGSGTDTVEGVDTGAGTSSNDLFVITGSNSGTYSRVTGGWSAVENLNGRGGNDTFRFEENGQLAGSVLGGSGTDTVEGVDTGAGTSSNDLFVITGSDSGIYSRVASGWSTVENLNGRGGDDTFRFEENGQLAGSVLGGSGTDTIEGVDTGAGTSSSDLFVITGSNSGTYSRVTGGWSTVENLNGRGGDDTFRFEENGQLAGSVLGGSGTDTIEGVDTGAGTSSNDLFVITGSNSGTYSRVTGGWSTVENLNGRGGNDTFRFEENGQLAGNVVGGSGTDTIEGVDTGAGTSSNDLFVITGNNSGTYNRVTGGWSTVENLNGRGGDDSFTNDASLTGSIVGGLGNDSLSGTNSADAFVITAPDAGTLTGISGGWSQVENLLGRGGDDSFTNDASLTGSIVGGLGNDSLSGTNSADAFVIPAPDAGTLTGIGGGWSQVENLLGRGGDDSFTNDASLTGSIVGGSGNDSLSGTNNADAFVITGPDAGTLTGIGGGWSQVENLLGRGGDDSFTNDASLTGSILGGSGNDSLSGTNNADAFVITSPDAGTLTGIGGGWSQVENLFGRGGDDSFTNDSSLTGRIVGGGGNDSLSGTNNADEFTVILTDSGTLTNIGAGWSEVENLFGRGGNDRFIISSTLTGNLQGDADNDFVNIFGNPSSATDFGKVGGAVSGGTGTDTLQGGVDQDRFVIDSFTSGVANGRLFRKQDGAVFQEDATKLSDVDKKATFSGFETLDGQAPDLGSDARTKLLGTAPNCFVNDRADVIDFSLYAGGGVNVNWNGGAVASGTATAKSGPAFNIIHEGIESAIGTRFVDVFTKAAGAQFASVLQGRDGEDEYNVRDLAADVLFVGGDLVRAFNEDAICGDNSDSSANSVFDTPVAGSGSSKEGENIFFNANEFVNRSDSILNYNNFGDAVRAMVRYMYITLIDVDALSTEAGRKALDAAEKFWTTFTIRNGLSSAELVRSFLYKDVLLDGYINKSQSTTSNPFNPSEVPQPIPGVDPYLGMQDFFGSFFGPRGLAARVFGSVPGVNQAALAQQLRSGVPLENVARSVGLNLASPTLANRFVNAFRVGAVYDQLRTGPNFTADVYDPTKVAGIAGDTLDPNDKIERIVGTTLASAGPWLTAIERILNTSEFLAEAIRFTLGTADESKFDRAQESLPTRLGPKNIFAILGSFDERNLLYSLDSNGNFRNDGLSEQFNLGQGIFVGEAIIPNRQIRALYGDWDGNGTDDLGYYDQRTGEWFRDTNGRFGLSRGNGEFRNLKAALVLSDEKVVFGANGDIATPGDWNADRVDDLGVFRQGTWFIDANPDRRWGAGDQSFSFGGGSDRPVVGDWDGNRADDFGVFRINAAGQGIWYLDTNGVRGWQGNDTAVAFGIAKDIPVVGDFNGDGKDDIGVYRPGENIWYLDTNGIRGWQGDDRIVTGYAIPDGSTPLALNIPFPVLQQAAGTPVAPNSTPSITQAQLDKIVDASIALWSNIGIDAAQVAVLRQTSFRVVDLPRNDLGAAWARGVSIDVNAAGFGWFVDSTPMTNEEFVGTKAKAKSAADGRMDLLSVVLHEMGHLLGLGDSDADGLMSETLSAGTRRLPTAADVDAALSR